MITFSHDLGKKKKKLQKAERATKQRVNMFIGLNNDLEWMSLSLSQGIWLILVPRYTNYCDSLCCIKTGILGSWSSK